MKQKSVKIIFRSLLFLFLLAGDIFSFTSEKDWSKKLHILFIGNSLTYANDLPSILDNLLNLTKIEDLKVESLALPNYGLQDHWEKSNAIAKIEDGKWDIIVLQQGPSATEGRPSLLKYSKKFSEKIREAGAVPALYMVWPAINRKFDFAGVSDSYQTAASLVNGLLFPVGEAWQAAWKIDDSLELYSHDGYHPSLIGSYLAALVMFDRLTDFDLSELPGSIPAKSGKVNISNKLARVLIEASIKANRQFTVPK